MNITVPNLQSVLYVLASIIFVIIIIVIIIIHELAECLIHHVVFHTTLPLIN